MRIVTLSEFVKLPAGTIFQFCGSESESGDTVPEIVDDSLNRKGETVIVDLPEWGEPNDFFYLPLHPILNFPTGGDEPVTYELPDSCFRWGMYDDAARFVVLDAAEVERLVRMFREGLPDA